MIHQSQPLASANRIAINLRQLARNLRYLDTTLQSHAPSLKDAASPLAVICDRYTPTMTSQQLEEFHQHLKEHIATGVNGEGEEVDYVPPSALRDYWTRERIDIILGFGQSNSEMILRCFCRVFSILVYIGQPQEITWFCKSHKNLDDTRLDFDETCFPRACRWAASFLTAQWMFIPLILTEDKIYNRVLPPQTILPVSYVKPLTKQYRGQDTATLWEVRVHPEANKVTLEAFLPWQ